jgi:hypothetical protein
VLHPRLTGDKKAATGDEDENNPLFVVVFNVVAPSYLPLSPLSSLNKNRYNINAGAKTNQYDECTPAEIPAGNKNA